MQSQRLASMLIDVDAAMRGAGDGPSIVLSSGAAPGSQENLVDDLGSQKEDAMKESAEPEAEPVVVAEKDHAVHVCAAKEGEQKGDTSGDADLQAEAYASTGIIPDMPQPAVLLDSSCIGRDGGDQDDVNIPGRSVPVHTRQVDRPSDFWDDRPSFELWIQDSVFNKIPDRVTPAVADTPCAEKAPTECMPDYPASGFILLILFPFCSKLLLIIVLFLS